MTEVPDASRAKSRFFEISELLAFRSNFKTYGDAEIFVDQQHPKLIEISPEAAAAKLVADLHMLLALDEQTRKAFSDQRHQLVEPIRKLVTPLITGETPFLKGSTTPEHMFLSMVNWLDPQAALEIGQSVKLNAPALAVFLILDVLLDGADLRQALGRNVKLNMPQMFRCLCHLLVEERSDQTDPRTAQLDDISLRRSLLVEHLRLLQAGNIARQEALHVPTGFLN